MFFIFVSPALADELDEAPIQDVQLGVFCIHVTPGIDETLSTDLNNKLRDAGLGYLRWPNVENKVSNYQIFKEAINPEFTEIRYTSGGENVSLQVWQVEQSLTNPLHEYAATENGPKFQPFMYRIGAGAFDMENEPYLVRAEGEKGCYFEKANLPARIAGAEETAEDESLLARFMSVVGSLATLLASVF